MYKADPLTTGPSISADWVWHRRLEDFGQTETLRGSAATGRGRRGGKGRGYHSQGRTLARFMQRLFIMYFFPNSDYGIYPSTPEELEMI